MGKFDITQRINNLEKKYKLTTEEVLKVVGTIQLPKKSLVGEHANVNITRKKILVLEDTKQPAFLEYLYLETILLLIFIPKKGWYCWKR